MAYFDPQQTGRLMARVTSDVGSILSFVNSGLLQLLGDLLMAVGIAGVLVWLHWRLALIAFVVVPLYAVNHGLFAAAVHASSIAIRARSPPSTPCSASRSPPCGSCDRSPRRTPSSPRSTNGSTPTAP